MLHLIPLNSFVQLCLVLHPGFVLMPTGGQRIIDVLITAEWKNMKSNFHGAKSQRGIQVGT